MFQSSEKDMEECGPGSPSREGHPVASRSELALEVTSEPPAWCVGPGPGGAGGPLGPSPAEQDCPVVTFPACPPGALQGVFKPITVVKRLE